MNGDVDRHRGLGAVCGLMDAQIAKQLSAEALHRTAGIAHRAGDHGPYTVAPLKHGAGYLTVFDHTTVATVWLEGEDEPLSFTVSSSDIAKLRERFRSARVERIAPPPGVGGEVYTGG